MTAELAAATECPVWVRCIPWNVAKLHDAYACHQAQLGLPAVVRSGRATMCCIVQLLGQYTAQDGVQGDTKPQLSLT